MHFQVPLAQAFVLAIVSSADSPKQAVWTRRSIRLNGAHEQVVDRTCVEYLPPL